MIDMRFHGYLEDVLGSREKVRLLRLFLRFPSRGFSANEAARLAGCSPMGAWRIAKEFEAQGLVFRKRVGASDDWQLSSKHHLAGTLSCLASENALDAVSRLLVKKMKGKGVVKIILYGSVARKDERANSDLDVLFLVQTAGKKKKLEGPLLDVSLDVSDRFGNRLSPWVLTEGEFKEKLESGSPLALSIQKEGHVLHVGEGHVA